MGSFSIAGESINKYYNKLLRRRSGHDLREKRGTEKGTYEFQGSKNNIDKSRRCIQHDKCTLPSDLPLDTRRFADTYPDKDRHIYFECMLGLRRNRCSVYILVCNLRMDFRNSQKNIGMSQRHSVRCIEHWHRKGSDCMGQCDRVEEGSL